MDRRAVPAPHTPTSLERLVGGFRQGLEDDSPLLPGRTGVVASRAGTIIGRTAAVLAVLLLLGVGVIALLAP